LCNGSQVGIVSQLETAAEKKAAEKPTSSLFRRNLTSVYTAATLIGDDIRLDDVDKDAPSGSPQTIISIVNVANFALGTPQPAKVCFVSVQPLTGKVVFDECPVQMLDQRLSIIQPIEILIPSKNVGGKLLTDAQRQVPIS
jgi:DNA mismatch repair protein MSH3